MWCPIALAARVPRGASGRSWSGRPVSSWLDFAWRSRNSRVAIICTMTYASPQRLSAGVAKILVAPDSFKGTLSASEVVTALSGPLRDAGYEVAGRPLADGGEGTAEALLSAAGGTRIEAESHDPFGRPIESWYALLEDGAAVVETAAASALGLIGESERDPERASTRG